MNVVETCPNCDNEISYENISDTMDSDMTRVCPNCGKVIVLCDKCYSLNGDDTQCERDCFNCPFCDLANFMNYLRGKVTIEKLLESLNPSLTDMTTGLPEGAEPTYDDFINDTFGDGVSWDVTYWECYGMVKECFLNADSSEADCRDFVKALIEKNRG